MDVNPGTIGERAGARSTPWAALLQLAGPWRVFLGTSAGWLVISVIVLRFTLVSVALAGVVVGVVFLLGAFGECLIAAAKARRGREGSAAAASRDHDGAPRIARCWSDSVCAADMVQPARTAKTGGVTWHGLRRLGVRHVMGTSRERESFAQLTDRALAAGVTTNARCAEGSLDPDEWFPVSIGAEAARREAAAAIAICTACPVRDACLELSLRRWTIGQHGVWGGLVAAERVALRRRWLASAPEYNRVLAILDRIPDRPAATNHGGRESRLATAAVALLRAMSACEQ